ncbi:putative deoxyribonuclease YcfH [Dissulfuribacter thermophilus]|uniref:Putative deoxyribonuclease YcfH n=1 Tax=Dissulfuribacter thermophilus TaxID=1156395 RepID=A0A1B9F7F9_9BACT|nr:TatD family hydrolase [Dissulfuribacter thermophilus]OCC15856.1 putative deoxyribonuclease YcfH [Dissulfuribacter thermophilus]
MKLIDTHAHLTSEEFKDDLGQCLEIAERKGVKAVVSVSEDIEDAKEALRLSKKFPMVYAGAGLFPTHTDFEQAEEMFSFIRENAQNLVCIGEVGLDRWKVQDPGLREIQEEIFKGFIELSKETGLPLNCHSRSAGRKTIEILIEKGAQKVQLHAFDGKASIARLGEEAGFFFSIPPSVIRSRQKQKLVKALSLSSILIETDSPVLGPDPTVRNEPQNAIMVIEAIAEIKGEPKEKVEEFVGENTKRLYSGIFRNRTQ